MSETDQETRTTDEPQPKYVTRRTMHLTVLCACLLTVCISLFVYDRYFATKIVIYDLDGKLQLIKQAAEKGAITFQQAEQVSAMEIAEAKRISDMAPSNYVVLSGGAVLGSHTQIIGQ